MRSTLLIVDDGKLNRTILRTIFQDQYNIIEAENGKIAIDLLQEHNREIVAVLLDVVMPVLDGFGVLDYMKRRRLITKIPVLLITSETALDTKIKSYDMGVSDYIGKPFDSNVVERRVNNAIDLYYHKNNLEHMVKVQTKLIKEQDEKLNEINEHVINTLGTIMEFRNLSSSSHILHIKEFTKIILVYLASHYSEYKLTKEKIDAMVYASAMHDVGKILIPDSILLKPGKLTQEEFEIVKTHTTKGRDALKDISTITDPVYLEYCCEIAMSHHERFDGKGYPQGLVGDEIPISAQAVSLADVYDALLSKRVYKERFTKEEAYNEIMNGNCGVFNPKLLECLRRERKRFEEKADMLL